MHSFTGRAAESTKSGGDPGQCAVTAYSLVRSKIQKAFCGLIHSMPLSHSKLSRNIASDELVQVHDLAPIYPSIPPQSLSLCWS